MPSPLKSAVAIDINGSGGLKVVAVVVKEPDGFARDTLKLCVTDGAGLYPPLPDWLAVIEQVPAARRVTLVPEVLHTDIGVEEMVTGSPEFA
jgi:hypothetical protein